MDDQSRDDDRCKKREPLLTLKGVCKQYKTKTATVDILENSDFSIFPGETMAVVGASGIGKSTLLNIIGTLDRPDRGRLLFKDQDLLAMNDDVLARFRNSKIGFVFQFHYLLQGFTTLENVLLPGLIAGTPKKTIEKQASNMLERVGLDDRRFYRVEDLSGGEQQRAAIARALVMSPSLLLADEPTGNLDEKNSDSVHDLFKDLNRDMGMTIIVVTHNTGFARMMDRKVTLHQGRIIAA